MGDAEIWTGKQALWHGTAEAELPLHEGLCLAETESAADGYRRYNRGRYVHAVILDFEGLRVMELDDRYDRDANTAPADADPRDYDADVIIFTDETPDGKEHATYRLLTAAALAAVTVTATADEEE